RTADHRFCYTEASWAEQRAYLDAALAALEPADRPAGEAALREALPAPAATPGALPEELLVGGWRVRFDRASGDLDEIASPDGITIAGRNGGLLGYRYESYDAADVDAHMDSYLTHRERWAILDHCKPGLERASTARSASFAPRLLGADG